MYGSSEKLLSIVDQQLNLMRTFADIWGMESFSLLSRKPDTKSPEMASPRSPLAKVKLQPSRYYIF